MFCLKSCFIKHDVVRFDGDSRFLLECADVFLPPEIAEKLAAMQSEMPEIHRKGVRNIAAVEKTEGDSAVFKRLLENVNRTDSSNTAGGPSERVLVDREDFVVDEKPESEGVEAFE